MAHDLLEFLQIWYQAHCDGDWEHQFGVEIGTLDNPGWRLAIDLEETELAGRSLERQVVDRAEDDWWQAWSDGTRFHGAAGARNLADVLGAFRRFVEDNPESE